MKRRGICVLLIALQLMVPGLSIAHVHEEEHDATQIAQPLNPPSRPHVHLIPFVGHQHPHSHSHGHDHGDDGSNSHHEDGEDSLPEQSDGDQSRPDEEPKPDPCDHDESALPVSLNHQIGERSGSSSRILSFLQALRFCDYAFSLFDPAQSPVVDAQGIGAPENGRLRAPPPIYLSTLHLLI